MNAQSTRLMKEARQLLAPWCGMMLAGLIALAQAQAIAAPNHGMMRLFAFIVPFGIFIGMALLATLPIGYDFQWRTLSLLLSQPVERASIWRDKMIISMVAVLPVAAIYLLAARHEEEVLLFAGPWLLATIAASMFWTLVARSTIGGLALNVGVTWLLFDFTYLATVPSSDAAIWLESRRDFGFALYSVAFVYAVLTLWLGRWLFLRIQVAEGIMGNDFLANVGGRVVPRAVADGLRCRANSPVLNLVRRELHLLRPVWPLTILSALAWTTLLAFGRVQARIGLVNTQSTTTSIITVGLVGMLIPLIGLLSGALSLGEEKSLGTHNWHMTLPLDPRLQWLVKLSVSITVAAVCGGLVPAAILVLGGLIKGGEVFYHLNPELMWLWPVLAAAIAVAAFWCACVVKGTIRAILWVFPVFFVFGAAASASEWIAETLLPRLNPAIDVAVMWLDPFRITRLLTRHDLIATWIPVWLSIPAIAFLVFHSYRQFRGQSQDTNRHLAACVLPPTLVVCACSFALWGGIHFTNRAQHQKEMVFREMHDAVQQLRYVRPNPSDSQPIRLTVPELAKASPLSAATRHWLGEATITVTPGRPHSVPYSVPTGGGSFYPVQMKTKSNSELEAWSYVAVMPLTNGSSCTMTFQTSGKKYGSLGEMCD